MTVGIAAISAHRTDDPEVVVSSDRMVTTRQQSAIEHEHPETKLNEIGGFLESTHLVGVVAGGVELGEQYLKLVNQVLKLFVQDKDEEPWVRTAAEIAAREYRQLVQDKIETHALKPYGLSLDDLSRQHQFKDNFLEDILAESDQIRRQINRNLNLLIGGVGPDGVGVYQINGGDHSPQNDLGYATIGSGSQPAESEFIKQDYAKDNSISDTFATVAAAHHQASKASGVGGELDAMIVSSNGVREVDSETIEQLMDRQQEIADEQERVRENILNDDPVDWGEQ
ncbi:hypothetical protein RYH80_08820 [Halobaculum sp. MBLA0147]|uniref:hypothetical protein n=1 Tax=Halobaculum sp. MBLA0147 TaxID=3079934 RepID=UPI003524FA6F